MAKTKNVNETRGNLRSALLKGAVRQVSERGAEGLMVAELARELSISTAAPYRHFADREAVLHAVSAVGMERLGASMTAAAATVPLKGPKRIVAIGNAYLKFARDEPKLFGAMFSSGREGATSPDARHLKETGTAAFGILLHHVCDALDKDMTAPEPWRLAVALWYFVHGQAVLGLNGNDSPAKERVDENTLMQQVANLLLVGTQDIEPV